MITLNINGKSHELDVEADMPLLWVIRDAIGLTGTKFGCGIGACGSCAVLLEGSVMRSCLVTMGDVAGKHIKTIEGLSPDRSHPVQQAWIAENVPQCGYCQSGMILATVALLERNPHPTDADIDAAITNICRCGTYNQIRKAIHRAAKQIA
jgi:isoquinoline 1-oxidoreductase alpha subunit